MNRVVALAISLSATTSPAFANLNSCRNVILAWQDASDCQTGELLPELTWPDGYTYWPESGRGKWSDINMSGPCPKYDTTIKEMRISPIMGSRQVIDLKAVTRRVDFEGRFTGDYIVTKETYTCEQRKGQWRIFSKVVTQRADLQNKTVMQQYEKSKQR